jgi:oxalate---CoA ligase
MSFSAADRSATAPSTILEMIQRQVEHRPDAVALMAPGRTPLTFAALRSHVHSMIAALNAAGIARADRVAVVLPNGPEMALAFLGVASGATCAPLNPAYHPADFEFYLTDLKAKALLTAKNDPTSAREVAHALGLVVIEIEPREAAAGLFSMGLPDAEPVPYSGSADTEDIALILHTSGTTSRPKIVPLTQRNLCASAHNVAAALELQETDCCLNVMPLFHIHGLVAALLATLASGGSVICAPGLVEDQFFAWMAGLQPTWYTAVPTMHQAVLARAHNLREVIAHTPLRFIRSSSSALPPQVMEQLENSFSVPVIEAYGMTEAAHQMASNPLPPATRKPRSVGRAAGPEVAIMGEGGVLLPPGLIGEIVIRGPNVTPGYENNPQANANAFHNGWFRTGDQGQLDADGYLFITGRIKEIVNRGGEKISPREIDEALMDHADVVQAVAFAVPHPTLGEDLAAAVVLRPQAAATEQDLRAFAFERLADFKVPSQIVLVDAIPKGATGKLQRIGLADKLAELLQRPFVAPRDEIETVLAAICCEVLQRAQISVFDNFFALGGDSLRATQVIARVRATLPLDVPITTIFRKPTIAEFADEVRQKLPTLDWIEQAMAEVGALSDEEAQRLLTQELRPLPRNT